MRVAFQRRGAFVRHFAKASASASKVVIVAEDEVSSRLGHAGDIVSVRGGFARNYLVPRRLGASFFALPYSPPALGPPARWRSPSDLICTRASGRAHALMYAPSPRLHLTEQPSTM